MIRTVVLAALVLLARGGAPAPVGEYPAYLHGVVVPMITPYRGDAAQEVDLAALARFTDYLCTTRASALFPCAGMGQWPLLSVEEKKAIIDTCVEAARGRKPILAGVGSDRDLDEVLEVARHAVARGVDAVVVVTPSFVRRAQPAGPAAGSPAAAPASYDRALDDPRQLIRDQDLLYD